MPPVIVKVLMVEDPQLDGMFVASVTLLGATGDASEPLLTVDVPGAGNEIVSVGAPDTAGVPPL